MLNADLLFNAWQPDKLSNRSGMKHPQNNLQPARAKWLPAGLRAM